MTAKGTHAMIKKQDTSASVADTRKPPGSAEMDVWDQLAEYAARADTDPVLRLLVEAADESHRNLRGVTATIANRYRALIDAVPDAITIHDETGHTLDVNESACRLLGQQRDGLLGRTLEEIFPDLDLDIPQCLHNVPDRDANLTSTSTLVRVDGQPTALELSARSYLDGQQQRIIVATRDLGPREHYLEQLRHSEAEFRRLMRDMDKGVVVRNRKGLIVASNPAACRMLRMSEPDLLALRTDQLVDWHFVDEHEQRIGYDALPWSRAITSGKAVESAICGLSSPGSAAILWVSVAAVPRFGNDKNSAEQVVSVFADISPIKQDASLFAHAQSLTNLGAWQLKSGSEHMIWSAQMHSIFDVPFATPVSRERMLSHFTGMDKRRVRQAVEAAKFDEITEIMARITTAIGRRRQVRIRVRALACESAIPDVIGCVQDVTGEAESGNSGAAE